MATKSDQPFLQGSSVCQMDGRTDGRTHTDDTTSQHVNNYEQPTSSTASSDADMGENSV